MRGHSRRKTLGAIGTAMTGALSGCGLLSNDSGTPVTTERPPLPYAGSTSPPYRPWLYAPSVHGGGEPYTFASSKLKELPDSAIGIGDLPYRDINAVRIVDGISVKTTDYAHVLPAGFVIMGRYQLGPLREELKLQTLEPVETYKTVTLWAGSSANAAVGVKPGLVIRSGVSSMPPADMVKLLIDVATGDEKRYTNVSDTCGALVSRLPPSTALAGRPSGDTISLADVEGTGISWDIGTKTATTRSLFVYPDAASVDPSAVEAFAQDQEFYDGFQNMQVETDGRVAIMTADVTSDRVGRPLLPPWLPGGMNKPPFNE